MKKFSFALLGTAAIALSACHRDNQDQVNNVELNQPTADVLNEQANEAAADAANTAAAANQAAKAADTNASANVDSPEDDQEQNVSGM